MRRSSARWRSPGASARSRATGIRWNADPFAAKWFYGVYALCVVGSAALVGFAPDLVWLNIAAQVLNALLLPLVIGFLLALAVKTLPEATRPRGAYLWILIAISISVMAVGVFGAASGAVRVFVQDAPGRAARLGVIPSCSISI